MSTETSKLKDSTANQNTNTNNQIKSSLSPTKMVLSTIPIDGSHVVIRQTNGSSQMNTATNLQSQQQHHLISTNQANGYTTAPTQIHRNSPASAIITTSNTKSTYISNTPNNGTTNANVIANNIPTQSKYVFLQQNGNGQFTTNEVVLVATEPIDMATAAEQVISVNEAGTATMCDEELTSLSWLHDKNLLKGFVSCAKNTRKVGEQRVQAQAIAAAPVKIINAGGLSSPTSEYIEESTGISEENTANIENGSNEYSSHQQVHYGTTTNNNNHTLAKNRNGHQIFSPIHTGGNTSNTNFMSSNQSPIHEQVNGSMAPIGATTTVHVGPSGTTTVVEYKSNSSFTPSRLSSGNAINNTNAGGTTITPATNNYVPSSPQRNVVLTNVTSQQNHQNQQQQNQQTQQQQQFNSSTTLSTTHHPHKKYLREKMNGFDQSGGGGTNNSSGGANSNKSASMVSSFSSTSSTTTSNASSSPVSLGSNFAINTVSHTSSSQAIATLSPEPPREYHTQNVHLHSVMKSPASYSTNSYENDSLKDFELTPVPSTNNNRIPSSVNGNVQQHSQLQQQQHQPLPLQKSSPTPPKQKHPTNVPYDPLVHTHNKPPYSFSSLIFMAIEGSTEKALPVKEIYAWIVQHFPYFKTAPTGWKNSVRHNLSLNKSFVKVEKAPNMGKGSLWRVEQQQRQNLIQALSRSPFFPNSAVDKISLKSPTNSTNGIVMPNSPSESDGSPPMTPGKSNLDARLFPNLSKAIKLMETNDQDDDSPSDYSTVKLGSGYFKNDNSTPNGSYENIELMARDCGADSIDDVNAATAMLALKHGPKVFHETFHNGSPVITSSPSEDHTYSAGGGGGGGGSITTTNSSANCNVNNSSNNANFSGSLVANGSGDRPNGFSTDNQSNCASSDAAYESSEESRNISPEELEDQQRHRDGVYALLSLSSHVDMSPIKRPSSTTVEEEHISSYMENIPHIGGKSMLLNGCGPLAINGSSGNLDEGYNTQSYYSHMASPSPPKKQKPLRNIRAKIKRKTTLIR